MHIEILNLGNFLKNISSGSMIDIAFPMLAFECEVSIPVEKEIDVYEEAILKFISIGLSKNSIRATLNITDSLCGSIFANLEGRGYITQTSGNNYVLSPKAENFLNDTEIINPEEGKKFGYMFISSIKKEVLWCFREGDIFNIHRADSQLLDYKLTKDKNESKTFDLFEPPRNKIEKAFSTFCRIQEMLEKREKGEISVEEGIELFADLEADLIETDYSDDSTDMKVNSIDKNAGMSSAASGKYKVRRLKTSLKRLFLQMRIIIDPSVPGGFSVESPFDFNGNDNEIFLRQIQWMMNPVHDVYIGQEKFSQFMNGEINKLLPIGAYNDISPDVFIRNELPILDKEKDKYANIYQNTFFIVKSMQKKNLNIMDKENIVGSFARKLIEPLMRRLFKTVPEKEIEAIGRWALRDFTERNDREAEKLKQSKMVKYFSEIIKVDRDVLPSDEVIFSAVKRLKHNLGNSIQEKLINLLVVRYYFHAQQIRQFFLYDGTADYIKIIAELNRIRNTVSHDDTGKPFTDEDYMYFSVKVFYAANRLLEALKKEE